MNKKSITAACCMAGLICILFAVSAATADKSAASETMETYEAAENPPWEEDTTSLEVQAEQVLAADRERYQQYIDQLDTSLADIQSRQQSCDFYRENIHSIYAFKKGMSGWLLAAHDEQGIFQVDWLMEDRSKEKAHYQRYRLCLFDDGSRYFTYQTDGQGIEDDIPDYLVNEDILRYYRSDYVYDDGSDLEEKRRNREETWQEEFDKTISGETLEFWYTQGTLYAVDRQDKTLADVSETKASCILAFLQLLPEHIAPELNIDETNAAQIKELIPDGYCLLHDWDDIAAYDLNEDGSMDYVMVLYPEDYPKETHYQSSSPYDYSPQYYASEFWLLMSDSEQDYLPIQLTESIQYPSNVYSSLHDVSFVGNGILRLEYYVARDPSCSTVLLFAPRMEHDSWTFYLIRSYYRDYWSYALQIGDEYSYGDESIGFYFYGYSHYADKARVDTSQAPLKDHNILAHYYITQYRCDNRWQEEMINSRIWQRENDILEAAQRTFASEKFRIITDPLFWNSRIVSYEMELDVWYGTRLESEEEEESDSWSVSIPIMLDRDTGEAVYVTDFIAKEEFMELFERYARKDSEVHEPFTQAERAQCMAILEEGWEGADSLDSLTAFDGKEISLKITQQGVVVSMRTALEFPSIRLTDYQIDKEHFMGTGLWYYLAPEWMQ